MGRPTNRSRIEKLLRKNGYELDAYYVNGRTDDEDFRMDSWVHKDTEEWIASDFGLEESMKFLLNFGIDEQITHGLGFNSKEQKFYGWSQRAIFGFGIGSKVSEGDVAYRPGTTEGIIADTNRFWEDKYHEWTLTTIEYSEYEKKDMLRTRWKYSDLVPNKELRQKTSVVWTEIPELGKGEWTAKTLEDAKQMANDFREGVS